MKLLKELKNYMMNIYYYEKKGKIIGFEVFKK